MRCIVITQAIILLSLLSAEVAAADTSSGAALYQQCVACHGDTAQGNEALGAPRLAGQYSWYLSSQFQHFKSALRGSHPDDTYGKQMQLMSAQLVSEQDIQAVSVFLSELTVPGIKQAVTGDLNNGHRYYQAKCGACHGGTAQGNTNFKAPRLSHLSAAYLQRQMDNFSNGLRGTHADDKPGRQMAAMAKTVSGKIRDDIIFFITEQE